ncbi:hypothetical protein HMPREF0789_1703 [Staphylococcus epidermidis BCM-HMP0060]|nr:hypothetical protein HMPREF0789_1703 [Staphylococcus epidermidis BCM-HMP0060]
MEYTLLIREVIIMTLSKQLKTYITERFKLNYQKTWACETVDAVAEDVLPEKYIKNSPLEHKILNTFTYYNDELHEISIYPFLCYLDKELVAIGYLDNFDLDFIFLNDTHQVIIDERYLLQKGGE